MPDLTPHSQWRLQVAHEVANRLRHFNGIQAIIVGGSVARNYADEYSDLELPLVWDVLPDDATRHAVIRSLQASFLQPYSGPANEDNLLIKGFQVDLWHATVAHEEAVLDSVLERYSTDLGDSNFLDTIRTCIQLHGAALIERWKRRAQDYPAPLLVRNIQEQLAYFDAGHLAIHAARDNPTLVYGGIGELQQHLFLVLLALNRRYFPSHKWMYRSIETMAIKPQDAVRRLRGVYQMPQAQAVGETIRILTETLALIEQHQPQIDTAPAHHALEQRRVAHEVPVRLYG